MSSQKKRKKKILLISIALITLIIIGIGIYGYNLLDKAKNIDLSDEDEDLGIDEDLVHRNKDYDIINVALFGIDKREAANDARSDSIIIASLDRNSKVVKLTSLMRDTYIDIPGRGMDKLGHAFAYGGPELAIQTINHNFNMDIREFMTVDFSGFEQIIESVGGVEIDITPAEANHMKLPSSGMQLLNGKQALDYSRIRQIGDDFERTERQRTVLIEVFRKMMNMNVTGYPNMLNKLLPLVETSITKPEMLSLGTDIIRSDIQSFEQFRIPTDEHVDDRMIDGVSYVLPVTLEDNIILLRNFIYEEDTVVEY